MRDISKAISLNPDLAKAYANRGWIYKSNSEYPKAVADFSRAIELEPQNPTVYTYRASCYMEMGQMDKAVKDLDKSISLDDSEPNPNALSTLAVLKEQLGDYKTSTELFQKVVQSRPDDALGYYNLGLSLGKQGKINEAIKAFSKSIGLDSNFREAYFKRAIAYEFLGDSDMARGDFMKALSIQADRATGSSAREQANSDKVKETLSLSRR